MSMIKTEFGIIECFDESEDYTEYAPERYHCVAIDDDKYLNDWWNSLLEIDTFNVFSEHILQPQRHFLVGEFQFFEQMKNEFSFISGGRNYTHCSGALR